MLKVKYNEGVDGLWYWHVIAKNGRIVAIGGEGYSTKSNARKAFRRVRSLLGNEVVLEK